MKIKPTTGFCSIKNLNTSFYVDHEKINATNNSQLLNEIMESSEIKLSDLQRLQNEVENVSSILNYRMMNLKALIDGNPMKIENISINNNSNPFKGLKYFSFPKEDIKDTDKEINDEFAVISEQSSAKIISPKLPVTKKSRIINGKRKIIDSVPARKIKIQKTAHVNTNIDRDNKPNYEIPNKFWELMEPYCSEINDGHLNTLEIYMQKYENDSRYYQLPEIVNDQLSHNNGQMNGSTVENHHLNGFIDNRSSSDLSNLLRNIDNDIRKPLSVTKALKGFSKHLVSRISQDTDELIATHKSNVKNSKNGISINANCMATALAKQLKVNNTYKIEKFIKKSMDDLGMCNSNLAFIPKLEPQYNLCNNSESQGIAKSNDDDMIDCLVASDLPNTIKKVDTVSFDIEDKAMLALRRRQAELKLVSESNLGMLKGLMAVAKRDLKRQEIERKLALADADVRLCVCCINCVTRSVKVIESYNLIESYRPSRKPPLKKDREAAYKSLRERQKVLKELDAFDSEFL